MEKRVEDLVAEAVRAMFAGPSSKERPSPATPGTTTGGGYYFSEVVGISPPWRVSPGRNTKPHPKGHEFRLRPGESLVPS